MKSLRDFYLMRAAARLLFFVKINCIDKLRPKRKRFGLFVFPLFIFSYGNTA